MKKYITLFNKFLSNNLFVFTFLVIIIFLSYHTLFNSYFESDEWFYFTYYLPITKEPLGLLTAISTIVTQTQYLSGGQHVIPIAAAIYFLNIKFFGLNFIPYAFMSLFIHSINSFLIFLLIKTLLINTKKSQFEKNFYAFIGSLFFVISPVPMHAITGFAAFYGQYALSVTFIISCILCYELAFLRKKKKFIFFTTIFLFLALMTQESSSFLFLILPTITIFKKKVFSYKFLTTIFLSCIIFYLIIRFIIPNIGSFSEKITNIFLPSSYKTSFQITKPQNLSIYPNLRAELTFRTITFPIRMVGSIFIPRDTMISAVQILAPIISPHPPGGDNTVQAGFLNYSGQSIIIYVLGLFLIVFCIISIKKFAQQKQYYDANYILTGLAIILFGALPLVAIIFVFPNWGYDVFFESRYYYNPEIGAAILFPFLILSLAKYLSKIFNIKTFSIVVILLLLIWIINNMSVFSNSIHTYTQNYSVERKYVAKQLLDYLPQLKPKTVFYIETDGKSPFSSLPFFTSVPQALTVIYFDRNTLPNSFYNKQLFSGKPEGYQYENDRGFGFYTSKKDLFDAIVANKFSVEDVYSFYYYGKNSKIKNITPNIREEINEYLKSLNN